MRNNPEEPHAQTTDVLPPRARMEDLQPKASKPTPPAHETVKEVDDAAMRQEEARTVRYAIGKLNDFVQWFMIVLEIALALRFFFMLIGASTTNMFASFLYALTSIVIYPFINIVYSTNSGHLEWQTLIAMLIYWLVFLAIRRFLHILITGPEEPAS